MGNNLIKSGVVFVDLSCMWKYSGKIKDHLFNHFEVAWEFWYFVLTMFGVQRVKPLVW